MFINWSFPCKSTELCIVYASPTQSYTVVLHDVVKVVLYTFNAISDFVLLMQYTCYSNMPVQQQLVLFITRSIRIACVASPSLWTQNYVILYHVSLHKRHMFPWKGHVFVIFLSRIVCICLERLGNVTKHCEIWPFQYVRLLRKCIPFVQCIFCRQHALLAIA